MATRNLACKLLNRLDRLGQFIRLVFQVLATLVLHPPSWSLLREQLYNMGVLSLGVVGITGLTTGIVLAAQSFYQLGEKGLAGITGVLVAKAMITELGPILTAFMVTGRVGSAMCAEIGSMKVTEQIDALKSMGISPQRYLIAPRFLAGIIMTPLLTLFCSLIGILGGYFISTFCFQISQTTFFQPIPIHVTFFDLSVCLIKSFLFGVLLTTICCYRGLHTSGGAAGVGMATTRSVVTSYIWILFFDLILTVALHAIRKQFKLEWIIR